MTKDRVVELTGASAPHCDCEFKERRAEATFPKEWVRHANWCALRKADPLSVPGETGSSAERTVHYAKELGRLAQLMRASEKPSDVFAVYLDRIEAIEAGAKALWPSAPASAERKLIVRAEGGPAVEKAINDFWMEAYDAAPTTWQALVEPLQAVIEAVQSASPITPSTQEKPDP